MAIPTPGAGRKGLVTFRLLGFPVTIHGSFLVVVFLIGYSGRVQVSNALAWVVVVTVSVIAHELGHALVAAPAGGQPRIDLYMMAGLTTWNPRGTSRGRRVAVSVAGPAAGVLFGFVVLLVYRSIDPVRDSLLDVALADAVWANFAWGVLNLLPMLPLDGGQVVYALMPGNEKKRMQRAAAVSLAVGVAVALAALAAHLLLPALLVMFFAAGNVQTLAALRRDPHHDPLGTRLDAANAALGDGDADGALALLPDPSVTPPTHRTAVLTLRSAALLRLGRDREARDVLFDLPPGQRVDPTYEAAVLLATNQEHLARERLATSLATAPDWAVRELVALLVRRGADVDEWLRGVGPVGAAGALRALSAAGRYADAARWGDYAVGQGVNSPYVAYDLARAWARAGNDDRALSALYQAFALGFADVKRLDGDADLAGVRALPDYAPLRERIIR